jgi:KUP system potassium uptake protein
VSAVEGIAVYQDSLLPYVVPISCVILVLLFGSQRFGTGRVGFFFGPIMLIWFFAIGALGKIDRSNRSCCRRILFHAR